MELHSTILWHLKREVPLCYLAKRAIGFDRASAYSCLVVGNCFSLQKEHDVALKFFQRAIQLQPDLAYAYTLSGHEYSANDDFEKAMACYRSAIRIDERHYNAWYGLGNIYYRQEKFDFAEHHLRKALLINPCSSPLYCYLGMALHSNLKTTQALEMLSNAIAIDRKNPLARFQKAQVLIALEQYDGALIELRTLVEVAPKEGSVYFVLGKVYKKLGQPSQAMVNLTRALDLSPKDAQQIKAAILNLEREDNADEQEEY
jgi:anaphase-promoting complex subunit 3